MSAASNRRSDRWTNRRLVRLAATILPLAALAACGDAQAAGNQHGDHADHQMNSIDRSAAMRATAAFQDVEAAEAAAYASSIDTLGCFQNPGTGGMGVHYINGALMDGVVDITKPEALVYELDADGEVTGLVSHEYIVPIDKWTAKRPPRLFGVDFHKHPVLPLWVLHTWVWKDNPAGMFVDWNPAVRLCPADVPVFGVDLPAPAEG